MQKPGHGHTENVFLDQYVAKFNMMRKLHTMFNPPSQMHLNTVQVTLRSNRIKQTVRRLTKNIQLELRKAGQGMKPMALSPYMISQIRTAYLPVVLVKIRAKLKDSA